MSIRHVARKTRILKIFKIINTSSWLGQWTSAKEACKTSRTSVRISLFYLPRVLDLRTFELLEPFRRVDEGIKRQVLRHQKCWDVLKYYSETSEMKNKKKTLKLIKCLLSVTDWTLLFATFYVK